MGCALCEHAHAEGKGETVKGNVADEWGGWVEEGRRAFLGDEPKRPDFPPVPSPGRLAARAYGGCV
eukprot:scaffold166794_cov32-Tisochrysis_lutea.AAC.1